MRHSGLWLLALLSILISISQLWLPLQAQNANKPMLQITGVNIDAFPQVEVSVYGQNLGAQFASIDLGLREDNTVRDFDNDFRNVGVQVAVVIDASRNIISPGITGDPRYIEIANAVRAFLDADVLSPETDWLSSYTIGPDEEGFQILTDWTQDHNAVANELFQYTPGNNQPTTTSLFGLTKFAMDSFDNASAAPNLQKQILIFSDGSDVVSALELENITNRALTNNISINTIHIGNDRFAGAEDNLQRIATLTRSRYTLLDSIAALNEQWQDISVQRGQRILSYRTDNPEPGRLTVTAQGANNREIEQEIDFPRPGARPVDITILQPTRDQVITREADSFDMPLEDMSGGTLLIEAAFAWPDGYVREPARVEYRLNNRTRIREEPPFEQFEISIAELDAGDYTLLVRATDELGLTGEADVVPFSVVLNVPPQPDTPTPEPVEEPAPVISATVPLTNSPALTATSSITTTPPITITPPTGIRDQIADRIIDLVDRTTGRQLDQNTALLLALFPFAILLFGLIYGLRRQQPGDDYDNYEFGYTDLGTENAVNNFEDEYTEPSADPFSDEEDYTEPAVLPDFDVIPPAHLIYVDGGENLPAKIPIDGGREIRIGRRDSFCDRVIDDKRVSRLHATIVERADGFYIRDEGSAGGTFVNRRKLGVSDNQPLKHSDIVNFNAISYRFELTDEADPEQTEPATNLDLNS